MSDNPNERISPLSTPSATREVLERHGLYTKYALGQNFLVNDDVLRKIVKLADVKPGDCVLEVGPGIGTLSAALLASGARVVAVEMDHDLPAVLADTLSPWADRFSLLSMDALDLRESNLLACMEASDANAVRPSDGAAGEAAEAGDGAGEAAGAGNGAAAGGETAGSGDGAVAGDPSASIAGEATDASDGAGSGAAGSGAAGGADDGASGAGAPDAGTADAAKGANPPTLPTKLVANLPYAVAATVVLDYLQRFPFLESATVMVQKEVADRMMARPGTKAYGAYTVKLSLYAQPSGRFPVAAGNFFPPPRVESAVVRLDRTHTFANDGRELSADELRAVCETIDAAFFTRRKTIANSMRAYFAQNPPRKAVSPSGQGASSHEDDGPKSAGAAEYADDTANADANARLDSTLSGPDIATALEQAFANAGIDPRRRGETLTRAEFILLAKERALLSRG